MKIADYTISHGMKSFKETIDLSKLTYESDWNRKFEDDIKGQIVAVESGKNILVKVYDTKEVDYRMVFVDVDDVKIKSGKNKGKYEVVTVTYKAEYDEDGNVVDYEDSPATVKFSYVKKKPTGGTTYQMVNSKGKVLETSTESYVGANKIVVDTSKTLGTLTFKNGDKVLEDSFKISGDNINIKNILTKYYTPSKKKNTYTGNWQNDEITSTKANETFNLGGGDNVIHLNMSDKIGKDKVKLSKDINSKLTLDITDDTVNYVRSGNNILVKGSASADVSGSEYQKIVTTITKDGKNYKFSSVTYDWNSETEEYDIPESETPSEWTSTPTEYAEVKASMAHEGVNYDVGTVTYYQNANTYEIVSSGASTGQLTLVDYLKNGVDNVYVGDTSLKNILESTNVAKLGSSDSNKKQKLSGTFLDETFTGGAKNDTITTGSGEDKIYLSKGSDKITINGNGYKYIYDTDSTGSTVISFAKGLEYNVAGEDESMDNTKTNLYLSDLYSSGYSFVKSGNDLILDKDTMANLQNRFNGETNSLTGSKVTIKDFFKNEDIKKSTIFANEGSTYKSIDDINARVFQVGNIKKANKISDTEYDDMLIGGKKADTFTIAKGGDNQISLDSGNDTINIKKSADEAFTTITQAVIGAGVDIINIEAGATPDIIIDSLAGNPLVEGKISYEKTGDDLTVKSTYLKEPNNLKKDVVDSIVIKNYFAANDKIGFYDNSSIYFFGENSLGEALGEDKLIVNGVYNKKTKTYEYKGTSYNDEFTYSGKNKAVMSNQSGTGTDDTYNITINKNSNLYINDYKGNDTINLNSDIGNLRLFFDITNSGNINGSQLAIFDKSAVNAKNMQNVLNNRTCGGGAVVEYFANDAIRTADSTYDVKYSDENVSMKAWISKITQDVVSWLDEYDYGSTSVALSTCKDNNALKELIACYSNVDYTTKGSWK